jgi:thymidylate synthase
MLTEKDIKNILIEKHNNKEFKFDIRTNQKFIEIVNANFISETGYIVYHDHHVTDVNWYVDNYDPILGDQIDTVVNMIKKDPDTRQAYIHMLDPNKYDSGDRICTIGMQVIYRKDVKKLDYIVYMRSNNVCEYTMDSNWQCEVFAKIGNRLISEYDKDISPGYLYWNAGSLHLYEEDFKFLSDDTDIAKQFIRIEKIQSGLIQCSTES